MSSQIQVPLQNFIFFFVWLALATEVAGAQEQATATDQLAAADSLFAERQYAESFNYYRQLFEEEQVTSPAMLMKMAFIQESRGDYSEALYYLNEYYRLTSDPEVILKIQQLSEEHNLQGYEYTDFDLFFRYFREYRYVVIYVLAGLALAGIIGLALTSRRQRESRPYGWGVMYLVLLGALFVLTNYSLEPQQAIIVADYTYIMDAPSAGAEVKYVSEKGHRVTVNGQEDVWVQIEWNGEPAFVRQGNLRTIRL